MRAGAAADMRANMKDTQLHGEAFERGILSNCAIPTQQQQKNMS